MPELRGLVYDWDACEVREFVYPHGLDGVPIRNLPTGMPRPCKVVDEDTGEQIQAVIAYNSVTGFVDRVQLDANGKVIHRANHSGIAVVTERRRVRLEFFDTARDHA